MAAPLLSAVVVAATLAWGQTRVVDLRLEAQGAAEQTRLRQALGIVTGDVLSRDAIRRGVQALMATGTVEDVTVSAVERQDGVELRVRVQAASRVRSLAIGGLPRRAKRLVARELALRVGAPLRVAALELALSRSRARLREDGYPEAELDPDLEFDVAAGTVEVRIVGTLGPPLLVHQLALSGDTLSADELWQVTRLDPGDRLTVGAIDGARRRLAEHLRRSGWWEAVVEEPRVEDGPEGTTLAFTASLGPSYRLDLEGTNLSNALESSALLFLKGEEPFSETALDATLRRVRAFLQRRGYLLASVTGEVGSEGDTRILRIEVEEARRTPVRAVRFPGLTSIEPEEIRGKVGARRGHPWRWGGEPLDDETLAADAASVLATLRSKGFAEATIGDARIVPEGDGVIIEFPVREGPRFLVKALSLSGLPADVEVADLPLAEGGAWSAAGQEQARETVLSALREAGYPDARVTAESQCPEAACVLRLAAAPGVAATVDRVVLAGLARTRPGIVEKAADLELDDWIGPEKQLLAQRRLLGLGIFRGASLRTIPGQSYGDKRGMVLELAESASRAVGFGIGWNTEDRLRVTAAWSELNLFGRARSLVLETSFSAREQRYQVSYREPAQVGLLNFPSAVAVYRSEERFATYDFLRRGMWVELGDRQKRPRRLLLRYDYQITRNNAPDEIKSELERERQNIAIASLTPTVEWDTRDDIFSPSAGVYASLQLKRAFPAFNAAVSLDKLNASVAAYRRVGGGVFAVALRGGGIDPHDDPAVVAPECDGENCLVPLAERFFAGGRVSHRAFPTDLLGIPGETLTCRDGGADPADPGCDLVAVGGAGLLLVSTEWRAPVWRAVGASVFVDGGNVWSSWHDVAVGDLRWGAGLGLRVMTPVGPFRLEYGWKLDRRPGESRGELFLSFGNPF